MLHQKRLVTAQEAFREQVLAQSMGSMELGGGLGLQAIVNPNIPMCTLLAKDSARALKFTVCQDYASLGMTPVQPGLKVSFQGIAQALHMLPRHSCEKKLLPLPFYLFELRFTRVHRFDFPRHWSGKG